LNTHTKVFRQAALLGEQWGVAREVGESRDNGRTKEASPRSRRRRLTTRFLREKLQLYDIYRSRKRARRRCSFASTAAPEKMRFQMAKKREEHDTFEENNKGTTCLEATEKQGTNLFKHANEVSRQAALLGERWRALGTRFFHPLKARLPFGVVETKLDISINSFGLGLYP
jgi:hypothetical protein